MPPPLHARADATARADANAAAAGTTDPRAEDVFHDLPSMLAEAARRYPQAVALVEPGVQGEIVWRHAELNALLDRVAATLQRRGLVPGDVVALIAAPCAAYVVAFFGALRAGLAVAPLAPGSTAEQLADMLADCAARVVFLDADAAALMASHADFAPAGARRHLDPAPARNDENTPSAPQAAGAAMPEVVLIDGLEAWLAPAGTVPAPVAIQPEWPFNIIYSSGTTGTPKGIVQSHAMRWAHIRRGSATGYGPGSMTLVATPLYSNTTLVSLIPSLAWGGAVALMRKFDATHYLALAERLRATHTMLVPVQYKRLLQHPQFDAANLASFVAKFCTSAPFHAELKAEVLRRWPGGLTEYYGMTEGGGTCILACHLHPHKLHTVGPPADGHDIRLIDEAGRELPPEAVRRGDSGEVVGRSPGMMTGYHRQPVKTADAEWFDAQGRRYIRTGDIGRFDEDGFLILTDRRKDMLISGGFNIYPSDLEAVLRAHPAVADVAVFGVPSDAWGETPVAAVVRAESPASTAGTSSATPAPGPEALRDWANARLGKTQRLAEVRYVPELPRSAIGKVLRRELRDAWNRLPTD